MTSDEAMVIALDWAEGRRSYTNTIMSAERSVDDRQKTLVMIAQYDTAEATKWASIATALSSLGR